MESEGTGESKSIEDRVDDSEQSELRQLTGTSNETDYTSDESEVKYSLRENKPNPKKVEIKKSNLNEKEGLESLVRTSINEARAMKVDPAEHVSAQLARNPVQYSESVLTKTENASDEEKVDTLDGSVVIVYYIDKVNGRVYLAFESKTETYPISEARGKLALLGGTKKLGESSPETASRELKEEDPDSYKILIKALKDNGRNIDEIREYVDGVPSWTSVYAAEIKDPEGWRRFSSTILTEGHKRILTLEETLLAISKNAFAFPTQGEAVYNFIIKENLGYIKKVD